jgi:peptide/nickel transport system permease protein
MTRSTLRFITGRVLGMVFVMLVTSFLVFSSIHLAPGDPVSFLLHGRPSTPATRAALTEQYHLNDPFFTQYFKWLGDILSGDFGRSAQFRQNITDLISQRLPNTLFLIAYAMILIVIVGLAFGILSALRPGFTDKLVLIGTGAATATPPYVAAIVLIAIFTQTLHWLPSYGAGQGFSDKVTHMTMPAIALALTFSGLLARVTRSAMVEELNREHVEVARSRGVAEGQVVRRHVLRNSLGPIVTVTGTMIASMLVSTSIVETSFSTNGVGSLLISSVTAKDFPVVQVLTLLVVATFLVCNLIVDLLQPLIDPRVTLSGDER